MYERAKVLFWRGLWFQSCHVTYRVQQVFENKSISAFKQEHTLELETFFILIFCTVDHILTGWLHTLKPLHHNNHLHKLSKLIKANDQIIVWNICCCIHNGYLRSSNTVKWMTIQVFLDCATQWIHQIVFSLWPPSTISEAENFGTDLSELLWGFYTTINFLWFIFWTCAKFFSVERNTSISGSWCFSLLRRLLSLVSPWFSQVRNCTLCITYNL